MRCDFPPSAVTLAAQDQCHVMCWKEGPRHRPQRTFEGREGRRVRLSGPRVPEKHLEMCTCDWLVHLLGD